MYSTTGRIDIVVTALDSIHHGAGVSGNTQLLRTQDIVLEDGREARVPFVSGNSLRHIIRAAGAQHTLDVMGVTGGLSKQVVDLLFSGGTLSKGGASVRLDTARRIAELVPSLSLMGYAAGNYMQRSKIAVDNLHLVCAENAWRVPESIKALPAAAKRAGLFRSEDFGTNMEPTISPTVAGLLASADAEAQEEAISEGRSKAAKASTQMIYDYEVLKPGSTLWGALHLSAVKPMELTALRCALSYACEGEGPDGSLCFRVGGKGSKGHGRVAMRFNGVLRRVAAPTEVETESLLPHTPGRQDKRDEGRIEYEAHLRDNRAAILETLLEAA